MIDQNAPKSSRQVAREAIALAERRRLDPTFVWGYDWGFPMLNYVTGGVQYEPVREFGLLISRPGVGKSAITGLLVKNVAQGFVRDGVDKVVRVVLLEMDAISFQKRIACMLGGVSIHKIDSGFASDEQFQRYLAGHAKLAALPIEYLAEPGMSGKEIEQFIRSGGDCGWFVVDHVGIVPHPYAANNPTGAMNEIADWAMNLTHRTAPGLWLGHQTREGEKGADKRPRPEHVAGSDKLTKNADLILGLYREDIYQQIPEDQRDDPKPAELLVLKQRSGNQATIHLIWHPKRTEFIENAALNRVPDELKAGAS